MDVLISQQGGTAVPLGLYQTAGVLIPGSGRALTPSDSDRVQSGPVDRQPDGSSLFTVYPKASAAWGKPFHFGGTVGLTASTNTFQSRWSVTIEIATDPVSGYDLHTYVGSGTTVLQIGQTFLMRWPVGSAAPLSSDAGILMALTDPIEGFVASQPVGGSTVTHGTDYMEQLFVTVATGSAVLSAPSAFDPSRPTNFGPSQRFIVRDDPRWTCSPAGGCSTPDAEQDNSRPDRYFPAGVTPSI